MKKLLVFLIPAALLVLSACSKAGSADIFANAAPEHSMLYFGWFDGKEGVCGYFNDERFEILDALKKVKAAPAPDFTPDKMTYPLYALDPQGKDGFNLPFLWTNGYIITRDGTAYHFKYDFSKLQKKEFASRTSREISSASELPNGFRLVLKNGAWDKALLTKAQDGSAADEILLQVTAQSDETLSLKLENKGSGSWIYGEDYALQVLLDGGWYHVPPMNPDGLLFHSIGYGLEPGQSTDVTCSLLPFGKLPAGQYRVSKGISLQDPYGRYENHVMLAEFTVD